MGSANIARCKRCVTLFNQIAERVLYLLVVGLVPMLFDKIQMLLSYQLSSTFVLPNKWICKANRNDIWPKDCGIHFPRLIDNSGASLGTISFL